MTTSELGLLDSNILVYAADQSSPFHQAARTLREKGLSKELPLCVCPQVLNEFFAVITNPKRVSSPRDQKEALLEMERYYHSKNILKIYPSSGIIERTTDLLRRYPVTRQEIFDVQLVATMLANNVTLLYTYNQSHFIKFREIEALAPT